MPTHQTHSPLQEEFLALMRRNERYISILCARSFPRDLERQRELRQEGGTRLYCLMARWSEEGRGPMTDEYFRSVWHNLCVDEILAARRRRLTFLPLGEQHLELPLADSPEREQRWERMVEELPEEERRLLEAYYASPTTSTTATTPSCRRNSSPPTYINSFKTSEYETIHPPFRPPGHPAAAASPAQPLRPLRSTPRPDGGLCQAIPCRRGA